MAIFFAFSLQHHKQNNSNNVKNGESTSDCTHRELSFEFWFHLTVLDLEIFRSLANLPLAVKASERGSCAPQRDITRQALANSGRIKYIY